MTAKTIGLFLFLIASWETGFSQILRSDYVRRGELVYYKDSLYTGTAITKSENGKITGEEHYEQGLASGTWREWFESGEKKFEGKFKQGKNDSVWTQWNRDGTVVRRLSFQNGVLINDK